MTVPASTPLAPDALDENRAGRLTDAQKRTLRTEARAWRKNELVAAIVFAVGGAVLLTAEGPVKDATARLLLGIGAIVVALVFLYRAVIDADPLVGDLRTGRVERVEGAVGKRHVSSGGRSSTTSYYLDVAGRSFKVARLTYDLAPDAGIIAVYCMPRSGHVVNLERLPDRALPQGALDRPQAEVADLAHSLASHDRVERAEAAATMAALGSALRAEVERPAAPPPPDQRDARPLAEAIVGSWEAMGATATFTPDGRVVIAIGGRPRESHWSVGPDGRLHGDMSGREEAVDAWVAADTLTISMSGTTVTFHRAQAG